MRLFAAVLVSALMFGLAPSVHAAHKNLAADSAAASGQQKHRAVHGTVVKVDGSTLVISVTNKNGQTRDRKIKTDDKTKVTVDGKDAKLADLKAGEKVTITTEKRVATEIAAVTSSEKPGATSSVK